MYLIRYNVNQPLRKICALVHSICICEHFQEITHRIVSNIYVVSSYVVYFHIFFCPLIFVFNLFNSYKRLNFQWILLIFSNSKLLMMSKFLLLLCFTAVHVLGMNFWILFMFLTKKKNNEISFCILRNYIFYLYFYIINKIIFYETFYYSYILLVNL